jgi:hypothetical protein
VDGFNSTAMGRHSSTKTRVGTFAYCSEYISANGDAQLLIQTLRRQTTDATATRLCSDTNTPAGTNSLLLANNSALHVWGRIIAHETATPANTVSWSVDALVYRGANAASTTVVGSTVTKQWGSPTWAANTPTLTADTTNGSIAVTVTGAAATTINWNFAAFAAEIA